MEEEQSFKLRKQREMAVVVDDAEGDGHILLGDFALTPHPRLYLFGQRGVTFAGTAEAGVFIRFHNPYLIHLIVEIALKEYCGLDEEQRGSRVGFAPAAYVFSDVAMDDGVEPGELGGVREYDVGKMPAVDDPVADSFRGNLLTEAAVYPGVVVHQGFGTGITVIDL